MAFNDCLITKLNLPIKLCFPSAYVFYTFPFSLGLTPYVEAFFDDIGAFLNIKCNFSGNET